MKTWRWIGMAIGGGCGSGVRMVVSGKIWALRRLTSGQVENVLLLSSHVPISSFGVDPEGEPYVVGHHGVIYRLVPKRRHQSP